MPDKSQKKYLQKVVYFNYLRETAIPVDEFVRTFFEQHYHLSPETRDQLIAGYRFGKPQLRPGIIRLTYELVGGTNWHQAVPLCGAVQVRETAYYCIDHILDRNADIRLLLLGGGYYSLSYAMACEGIHSFSKEYALAILNELCALDENTLQGAVLDATMHGTDEAHYWRKVEGYNFWQQAMKIGGLCGGAAPGQVQLLDEIGKKIGMAHIVANDGYDIAKDQEDFRQGKNTLPIIYAFAHASADDRATLHSLFGRDTLLPNEVEAVQKIMVSCGAIDYCKKEAAKLCDDALTFLNEFPDSMARQFIRTAITYVERNKYFALLDKLT